MKLVKCLMLTTQWMPATLVLDEFLVVDVQEVPNEMPDKNVMNDTDNVMEETEHDIHEAGDVLDDASEEFDDDEVEDDGVAGVPDDVKDEAVVDDVREVATTENDMHEAGDDVGEVLDVDEVMDAGDVDKAQR